MRTNFAIFAMARSIIGGHATPLLPGCALPFGCHEHAPVSSVPVGLFAWLGRRRADWANDRANDKAVGVYADATLRGWLERGRRQVRVSLFLLPRFVCRIATRVAPHQ